jgi:hypothetical protein
MTRRTLKQCDIKEATLQLPVRTGVLALLPLFGLGRSDGKYVPFIWKVNEFRVPEEIGVIMNIYIRD